MNKKRIFILVLIIAVLAMPAMADDYATGRDNGAGKTKIGTILGYGLFATVGFDTGGATEVNLSVGTGWGFGAIGIGANILFTLAEINIEDHIFPLSLGPQVDFAFGYYGSFAMDVLAMLRWEYTFWFPLNLFVEFGAGVAWNFSGYVGFGWQGGLGVRYVFGM